jgi:Amt family ammonium transporter
LWSPANSAFSQERANDPGGGNTGLRASDVPQRKPVSRRWRISWHQRRSQQGADQHDVDLLTGFLVMFMQTGFAMVETGLTQAKNAAHTFAMNFHDLSPRHDRFLLARLRHHVWRFRRVRHIGRYAGLNMKSITSSAKRSALWRERLLFDGASYDSAVFAVSLPNGLHGYDATIPTGRWPNAGSTPHYGLRPLVGSIIYPVYGNWVWGGGWLATLGKNFGLGHGHADFAGSSVVHLTGGVLAFVGALMIGPRLGKYKKDGTANVIPAHSIPMAMIGTFILAFGWFGFNPGSTLAGGDLRIAVVAVNTMLAGATGAFAATLWMWKVRSSKPDPSMMCNGMLAGLVAITAPCAFVTAPAACLIGIIAGILVIEAAFFIEKVVKIDDPVGAIAVHGVNGAWGCWPGSAG